MPAEVTIPLARRLSSTYACQDMTLKDYFGPMCRGRCVRGEGSEVAIVGGQEGDKHANGFLQRAEAELNYIIVCSHYAL